MINIQTALVSATKSLKAYSSARLEAEVLLAFLLKKSRSYLYAYSEKTLNKDEAATFQTLIEERKAGKPIAYITGKREFWSFELKVNEHTLIPRHATETLVEVSLELLKHQSHANILELGTGSGAIALALAKEKPNWQLIATDKSKAALEVAQWNSSNLEIKNIDYILSDWFKSIPPQKFDAIVSNPPYISLNDPHLNQGDLPFEPQTALLSGNEGLDDIKIIAKQAKKYLKTGGYLLLEHGYNQKSQIQSILSRLDYSQVRTWQDCEGNDRISGGIALK